MGDMGLQGAYGLDALNMLREKMRMQLAAQQQQEFQNQMAMRTADRADVGMNLDRQYRQDSLNESKRLHDQADQDRLFKENTTLNESIPGGTDIRDTSPVYSRLQSVGALSPTPIQADVPSSLAAGDTTVDVPGTVSGGPMMKGRLFRKNATSKQLDTQADNARQTAKEADALARETTRDAEIVRHNKASEKAAANKPVATIAIQTVDENGEPVTKIVPKVAGGSFAKPASAVSQNRADSAMTVKQTGEDMIAQLHDPKFAAVVGPIMGRASTLRDLIGNPPPEFAQLAGQIESYALANMGVHGMRSAQGSQLIAKLLDQHHTPESLIATIKGLNSFSEHFLTNVGRKGGSGGGGSDVIYARDPQGGLHQAKVGTPLPDGWKVESR
jgi:hypothetical protein